MSLVDEFQQFERKAKTDKCLVCRWLAGQSDEVREFFDSQADGNKAKLTRWCTVKYGFSVHESTMRDHFLKCHVNS